MCFEIKYALPKTLPRQMSIYIHVPTPDSQNSIKVYDLKQLLLILILILIVF